MPSVFGITIRYGESIITLPAGSSAESITDLVKAVMLDFSQIQNYFIACGYTDMRKQIDGLAAVVELQFGKKMDEETSIFLFCECRADRIKARS